MAHAALYFPYIEVPNRPSLTPVLLYWDDLATIAPWSLPELSRRMQELVDCGLVERIDPEHHLDDIEGFEDGFVSLLEVKQQGGGADAGDMQLVHRDKATWELWDELRRRGLVSEDHALGDGGWMQVEEWVARFYMGYLACCLGRKLDREPITDQRRAFAAAAGAGPSELSHDLDRMRAVVLANVLPAPTQPVPPRELAGFKEKHWDLLSTFRLRVEKVILESAEVTDAESQRRKLTLEAEQLEDDVARLESFMRRKWPTARGLFCAAVAGGSQAALTLDPASAGGPIVNEVVTSLLGPPAGEIARHSVAYAALARREFQLARVLRAGTPAGTAACSSALDTSKPESFDSSG
jgi:hypothetical protein